MKEETSYDRRLLEANHKKDLTLHKELLEEGDAFESDSNKVLELINELNDSSKLSNNDKSPMISELERLFVELWERYESSVGKRIKILESVMEDRIEEMDEAHRYWKKEEESLYKRSKEIDLTDLNRVRREALELKKKYKYLFDDSKKELRRQISLSKAQREAIRKRSVMKGV